MALDVLIVDDSPEVRKSLRGVLLGSNVLLGDIHEANDVEEALERMRKGSVGLVLSDINMVRMDGIEFLRIVKANPIWRDVPVMVTATDASQCKVLMALKLGAAGYVKRPLASVQFDKPINSAREAADPSG